MNNPWHDEALEREADFHEGSSRFQTAKTLVDNDYSNAPESFPHDDCPNPDARFYYKATIGAMKCSGCGALAWSNGEILD